MGVTYTLYSISYLTQLKSQFEYLRDSEDPESPEYAKFQEQVETLEQYIEEREAEEE